MPLDPAIVGWASAGVLLLTLSRQIHKEWRERSTKAVSKWLFIGQIVASAGFTTYSALVGDAVFIVTNALILTSAVVGLGVTLHLRRVERRGGALDG